MLKNGMPPRVAGNRVSSLLRDTQTHRQTQSKKPAHSLNMLTLSMLPSCNMNH